MTASTRPIALLNYGNTLASIAAPALIGETLRRALSDQSVWIQIEKYLMPPGVCGSKEYDHANAVRILRAADEHVGALAIPDRVLWNHLHRELKRVFQCHGGRVLGLLEDRTGKAAEENGAGVE